MNNDQRIAIYTRGQRKKPMQDLRLTPAQQRRVSKKDERDWRIFVKRMHAEGKLLNG